MKRLLEKIDRINEAIGHGVSWLTTALVLVVCYDVFTRYLLKKSSVAVQELEWHIFATIFLLAAAYALKHDRHVRVDVIYARLSPLAQAWINFAGTLLFLLPFSLMVIWSSYNFVEASFRLRETSPDPGGLPARYILKAFIPLGFFLVFLQGLVMAWQAWQTIQSTKAQKGSG
ncbi:MAG: TRAP transporter small permease subunit [Calditrichaeota bacterium]|nr:TRAP transporter small permease subunit [Calditrichota bacterium]